MRLKGKDLQDTEDGIAADVARGQLERGNSPWGLGVPPAGAGQADPDFDQLPAGELAHLECGLRPPQGCRLQAGSVGVVLLLLLFLLL